MKFKESLDGQTVIYQDKIEKIFNEKTVSTCLELEKTVQEFWNVDRQSANFLNQMIKIKNSKCALEIGTSNGYSAIWIAKALRETNGTLTTIEYWQKRVNLAVENFKEAGVNDLINVITGDAVEVLEKMSKETSSRFDFVFMDANKAEYIEYFNYMDKLLLPGGIIIADNILSHYKKTKNYVEKLMSLPNYQNQLLNFESGMMLSLKACAPDNAI